MKNTLRWTRSTFCHDILTNILDNMNHYLLIGFVSKVFNLVFYQIFIFLKLKDSWLQLKFKQNQDHFIAQQQPLGNIEIATKPDDFMCKVSYILQSSASSYKWGWVLFLINTATKQTFDPATHRESSEVKYSLNKTQFSFN